MSASWAPTARRSRLHRRCLRSTRTMRRPLLRPPCLATIPLLMQRTQRVPLRPLLDHKRSRSLLLQSRAAGVVAIQVPQLP